MLTMGIGNIWAPQDSLRSSPQATVSSRSPWALRGVDRPWQSVPGERFSGTGTTLLASSMPNDEAAETECRQSMRLRERLFLGPREKDGRTGSGAHPCASRVRGVRGGSPRTAGRRPELGT